MKCIKHPEIDAVSTCVRCGSGICSECTNETFFQIDNKPLCKKCNYDVGLENDGIFKSFLKSKQIKFWIFTITCALGIITLITTKLKGGSTVDGIISMLFLWGLGFIGNFFEKTTDTRSVKAQAKEALLEVKYPISSLIGKILGFFIMAVSSPLQILFLFIGIHKVKKQIKENRVIMAKMQM